MTIDRDALRQSFAALINPPKAEAAPAVATQASALTTEQLDEAADYLRGTCKDVGAAAEMLGIEVDETELQERLLEVDLELCVGCHWWHEVCELEFCEDEGGGLCDDCREERGIEA